MRKFVVFIACVHTYISLNASLEWNGTNTKMIIMCVWEILWILIMAARHGHMRIIAYMWSCVRGRKLWHVCEVFLHRDWVRTAAMLYTRTIEMETTQCGRHVIIFQSARKRVFFFKYVCVSNIVIYIQRCHFIWFLLH